MELRRSRGSNGGKAEPRIRAAEAVESGLTYMECNMHRSTIVQGMLAAAIAASMSLTALAATDKPAATAAPATAQPAAAATTAPAGTAPAGTAQGTGKAQGKAQGAAEKDPHQRTAAGGANALLTPDEQATYKKAMQGSKNITECNANYTKYDKLVTDRAKEKGVAKPADRGNPCKRMEARGFNP
jgi:hypothetical protein